MTQEIERATSKQELSPDDVDLADLPPPPPEDMDVATVHIQAFRKDRSLNVSFEKYEINRNTKNSLDILELYAADDESTYRIDPARNVIVEAAARARIGHAAPKTRSDERLSAAQLREIAIAYATHEIRDFGTRIPFLNPREDNSRRSVYTFRWEEPSAESDKTGAAMEVKLGFDGSLISFRNSLR